VVRWGALPLIFALGLLTSSCHAGLPTPLYAVLVCVAIVGWVQERFAVLAVVRFRDSALQTLQIEEDDEVDSVSALYLRGVSRALKVTSPEGSWRAYGNHWLLLQFFGFCAQLDLFTDAVMPGQVLKCEEQPSSRSFTHSLAAAWVPVAGIFIDRIGLFGLYVAFLLVVVYVSGVQGYRQARRAQLMAGALSQMGSGGLLAPPGGQRHVQACRRAAAMASSGVVAAEWAASSYAKVLFTELAGEFAYAGKKQQGGGTSAAQQAEETAKLHIQVAAVVRDMLLHHLPYMYLTQAFFSLRFDSFSPGGRAKVAASFALSAGGALGTAGRTLGMARCGSCYLAFTPLAIASTILAVVFVLAVKFVTNFTCPLHVYSLQTFSCVDGADIAGVVDAAADPSAVLPRSAAALHGLVAALPAWPLNGTHALTRPFRGANASVPLLADALRLDRASLASAATSAASASAAAAAAAAGSSAGANATAARLRAARRGAAAFANRTAGQLKGALRRTLGVPVEGAPPAKAADAPPRFQWAFDEGAPTLARRLGGPVLL